MIGQQVAHYEITEKIGAGGMGEVYKARDTRLGREVALKFLPETFALDADRLQRFDREAKLLAGLNHPNIAAIYGIEEAEGKRFLVLELIPGDDLSKRISQGPVPVDESIAIALQVADALEAAHDQGVIHRDLKPANIVVTPDGAVKVLDFGLAKALDNDPMSGDISNSPTIMGSSPTLHGVILGTAGYMSPEQARGKRVDRRADVWAFGCVLYEMLMGKQLFVGETVSDTLASVLRSEPEWDALPKDTPPAIVKLIRRCLDRDPRERLRDIGEARIILDRVRRGEADDTMPTASGSSQRFGVRQVAAFAVVSVIAALLVGAAAWKFKPGASEMSGSQIQPRRRTRRKQRSAAACDFTQRNECRVYAE